MDGMVVTCTPHGCHMRKWVSWLNMMMISLICLKAAVDYRVSHAHHMGVTWVSHEHHVGVAWGSKYHDKTWWWFHAQKLLGIIECYMHPTWVSMVVSWTPHGCHMSEWTSWPNMMMISLICSKAAGDYRVLYEHNMGVPWVSMVVTCTPHGCHMRGQDHDQTWWWFH